MKNSQFKTLTMIISLHTPKAGGSSFGQFLKNHFSDKFIGDYNDFPINKTLKERHKQAQKNRVKIKLLKQYFYNIKKIQCIHGHFLPYKYKDLYGKKDITFVTWLREPAERLASHYYYWMRAYNKNSAPLHKRVVEENWSFEKFCFSKEMQNFYSQFLWRFPISNFDFIGVTEYFDEDMHFFANNFLNLYDFDIPKKNINPNKKINYYSDKIFLTKLKQFHSKDYDIYNYALKKRESKL